MQGQGGRAPGPDLVAPAVDPDRRLVPMHREHVVAHRLQHRCLVELVQLHPLAGEDHQGRVEEVDQVGDAQAESLAGPPVDPADLGVAGPGHFGQPVQAALDLEGIVQVAQG